jgi:hypothetical protein
VFVTIRFIGNFNNKKELIMHFHAEVYLKELEDVDDQIADILYSYNEQVETEEYSEGEVSKKDLTAFVEWYAEEHPESFDLSFDELYDEYGYDWNGNCWRKTNGVWEEFSTFNPQSFYDWYQIGGRWTGSHDKFDPENDPMNVETCRMCNGTGFRDDELGKQEREKDPSYTCNGCGQYNNETKMWEHGRQGKGLSLKWPTNWARHDGDIIEVKDVPDDLDCYTLVVEDEVFHKSDFDGNVKKKLAELGITEGYLVTVDYHC